MQILGGEIVRSEITKNARGGSELMAERLVAALPADLLKDFQIILSRGTELDPTKLRIMWFHDLAQDFQAKEILKNDGHRNFHKLVFVSYWQRQQFIDLYKLPYHKTAVIQNAIAPIDGERTTSDKIRFIYHTTPHRGLRILVPVFERLCELHDNLHLDVYSSFKVYGWENRDEEFKDLFDHIKNHDKITYHGAVPNEQIREALLSADIYAYPNIWMETSALSVIEAMSAGVICIHPDLAALPETAGHWNQMYPFHEDTDTHAETFGLLTHNAIETLNSDRRESLLHRVAMARNYTNVFYDMEVRARHWQGLLESLLNEPRDFPKEEAAYFNYSVR
jgi:glycosyltransferase involved in cell wall biosynthesis